MKPCASCGRLYGHLVDCEVKKIHEQLDVYINTFGIECTRIAFASHLSDYERKRL